MGCFAIMRGSRTIINDTPIVDGQFFIETDQKSASDLTKYNKIYIDDGDVRKELLVKDWSTLIKPFDTIDEDSLNIDSSGRLNANIQSWNIITDKPFSTIGGTSLFVDSNQLSMHDLEWDDITTKPFDIIGIGLSVDEDGYLKSDIQSVSVSEVGIASEINESHQVMSINDSDNPIDSTSYMEDTKTLSTTENIIYTFNNYRIKKNSKIQVYTSIWGINPIKIDVDDGVCDIIFLKNDTATNMTCRIYIL